MREAALWACGAVLAFVITAGAFLSLANLATGSSEESLAPDPEGDRAKPGPPIDLDLDEDRLADLRPEPAQNLEVVVENTGDQAFDNVNLTLRVSSDDTAYPQTRYYRRTLTELSAGESVPLRFDLDLSKTSPTTRSASATETQKILEVRATTPEGVTAVRTAVVPM